MVFASFPSKFLNVILNDIVAQAIVSSYHVHRTLGGAHHTPLAAETLTRAAHPSGDPLMLMLPTPCYRLGLEAHRLELLHPL